MHRCKWVVFTVNLHLQVVRAPTTRLFKKYNRTHRLSATVTSAQWRRGPLPFEQFISFFTKSSKDYKRILKKIKNKTLYNLRKNSFQCQVKKNHKRAPSWCGRDISPSLTLQNQRMNKRSWAHIPPSASRWLASTSPSKTTFKKNTLFGGVVKKKQQQQKNAKNKISQVSLSPCLSTSCNSCTAEAMGGGRPSPSTSP